VIAHPWNESMPHHPGLKRVHSWDEIVTALSTDIADPGQQLRKDLDPA
jgi:hypothetical protein